jgi:hypothetical protein
MSSHLSADHRQSRTKSIGGVSSSHSMASEPVKRVFKVLESGDEFAAAKKSTENAACFIFVSPVICPANKESVAAAQELCEKGGDTDNIDFFVCDVNAPLGASCARTEAVASLPSYAFYFDGQRLEAFSGDSVDKFKVCCQAARGKRMQINKQKEKEKEDAEKAAADAAAAAQAPPAK